MKIASLTMVLILSGVAWADEPQAQDQVAQPTQAAAATDSNSSDDQAAAADDKVSETEGEAQEVPVHRNPTLLRMLSRNNELRTSRGLRPHRINPALTKAAMDHATFMARTRVFSHYANGGPTGRANKHGFSSGVLENIGYGYGNVDTMFTCWLNSSGHRASLMSNTTDVGFGYATTPAGTPYWVAVYGTAKKGEEPEVEVIELTGAEEDATGEGKAGKTGETEKTGDSSDAPKVAQVNQDQNVVPAGTTQTYTKRRHRR